MGSCHSNDNDEPREDVSMTDILLEAIKPQEQRYAFTLNDNDGKGVKISKPESLTMRKLRIEDLALREREAALKLTHAKANALNRVTAFKSKERTLIQRGKPKKKKRKVRKCRYGIKCRRWNGGASSTCWFKHPESTTIPGSANVPNAGVSPA